MSSQSNEHAQSADAQTVYDCVIIGGAAAGLSAALYASRRTLKTLVLTKSLGGQAALTPSIENYPGIEKIGGIELMLKFQQHAKSYGAEFRFESVSALRKDGGLFLIETSSGAAYSARTVILAFGLTPRNLDVPGELELQGKGVTYCATCDAPLFKGKSTAVVGGTYEALDAALLLSKLESKVALIHDKAGYPAYKKLFAQVESDPNITIHLNTSVVRVEGTQCVEGITIQGMDSVQQSLAVAAVFVEKGHKIDSKWVGDLVEFDARGAIAVTPNNETKTPGVFAAGDVTTQRDKQVVISAGEGAKAALSAYHYLQKQSGKPALRVDWAHAEEV